MDNLDRHVDKKTLDAFQSAVQEVPEKPPSNYMSTRELALVWQIARRTAYDRIKKMMDEGRIDTIVVRILGKADGRLYPIPHYRIKKK